MKSREALRRVQEITEGQWGLLTAGQARSCGVTPMTLARLCDAGDIIRIAHGVYRDAGSPSDEHESLQAAWLMTNPSALAYERLAKRPIDFVVSGESAARLHDIGDLRALRHEFTTPRRKQTQRADTRYRITILPEQDVTMKQGLPVTTPERTIADMIERRYDLSLIANMLRDAINQQNIDEPRLVELLNPLAKRNGHRPGDGHALLEQILTIAGMGHDALSRTIAADPRLGKLVTGQYLKSLSTALSTAITAYQSSELEGIQQALDTISAAFHPSKLSKINMSAIDATQLTNLAKALEYLVTPFTKNIASGMIPRTPTQRPSSTTCLSQSARRQNHETGR